MGNLASLLVIMLSFLVAHFLRFDTFRLDNSYLVGLLAGLLLCAVVLPATGAYREEFRWDIMRKLRRLIAGWAVAIMIMVTSAAFLKVTATYSRIWFGSWVLLGSAGLFILIIVQNAWIKYLRRSGRNRRRIVLVGSGAAAAAVESRMMHDDSGQFEIVARFGDFNSRQQVLPVSELEDFIARGACDDVWIATELEDRRLLEDALTALKECVVDVHVVPDFSQYRLLNQQVSEWSGLPIISLSGTPMTGAEWRLKSAMDRVGALFLVTVSIPLLALVALAVRISSPGPVIFRQLRHGIGGEPIHVLKFRTMLEHDEPEGELTQATPDDERVTRVGSFLRRTSLDEVPQLFNVLKGEMSLVGPRPHPVELNIRYLERIPKYMLRHKAKPGMTGWAQINGLRGITDTEEKMAMRIEHDLWYIQNWSIWLDLQILLRTPLSMFGRNAY